MNTSDSFGLPLSEVRPTQLYLTDGHTRAFVAHLAGVEELRVEPEGPGFEEEYDLDLYRECIGWCEEAGIRSVPDFAGRVLSQEQFEEQWVERCRSVGEG